VAERLRLLPVAILLGVALLGPWLAPQDPLATNAAMALRPPSLAHPFGTDQLGRDVLSRVIAATRLDLAIALGAVVPALLLGTALGAACGYRGGALDRAVGRLTEVLMAFPLFALAMVVAAALGNSVASVVIATAMVNLPFYLRLARAETALRREAEYVLAARVGGATTARVLRVELLPNIAGPLAVQASVNLGWAVLNAAGLSFLGLGVRAPTPEWGVMVAEGAAFIPSGHWWLVAFPGAALMLAVLAFNLCGDALRDWLDPRPCPPSPPSSSTLMAPSSMCMPP
jgi:peptide/nickel transport system permease protein